MREIMLQSMEQDITELRKENAREFPDKKRLKTFAANIEKTAKIFKACDCLRLSAGDNVEKLLN